MSSEISRGFQPEDGNDAVAAFLRSLRFCAIRLGDDFTARDAESAAQPSGNPKMLHWVF